MHVNCLRTTGLLRVYFALKFTARCLRERKVRVLHGRTASAPRRPRTPSEFLRAPLRWPSLLLPRRYSVRRNQLRHEGLPEGDIGAARMVPDCLSRARRVVLAQEKASP